MTATTPRPVADAGPDTRPPDPFERTLSVAGRRLRVAVRPAAPRPADTPAPRPLVLVNGIGASLELLEPLVTALDPRREVIRFDVPGIGGSQLSAVPLPMAALTTLLADLLDQLDGLTGTSHRVVDLLGLSWGGGIVQQFALQYPQRTGSLALVSTGTGVMMVPARISVLARMLTPRRYNDPSYRRDAGREIYVGEDPDTVDALFSRVQPVRARAYLHQLFALTTWTSLPVLPFIAAPTLVLAGRKDPVIPVVNAHVMGSLLPRAEVHLHRGGHLGLLTRPAELGPVVEDFLDRH
ncbi:alpha/beta hydrolase [Actinomycetospora sp. NBRC 106378]|uniref:alpha/beta fold hydrolase n=1 Tax=Actinomycetospora sp. NBRC 106378 TaxID=3032208 RepID=UPI0024A541EF|nr:alpha/beta hydrolase [Actinomycetospora sp. NBRC 106378]GLZ56178.1 poly(3-hydroxyalkanoic acid) depolymerase [Actinomycetospora sp. NBRC 106378]